MTPTDLAEPFRVLVVCTGNICRSPAAERLLAAGLGAAYRGRDSAGGLTPAIEVGSAGTGALVGYPMTDEMAAMVAQLGVDPQGFEARQLAPGMVTQADLVLALTRRHRSAIVELVPSAVRRTFTLRELARLAGDVDLATLPGANATTADRLRALVPLAATRRGLSAHRLVDDDVVDPYRGDAALYRTSFGQLLPAVEAIVAAVRH
ncbi:low molecular weight phosphatase family protein [uncultured Cellulomonas sp.]|uniref:arsenate reductase/protein-tyrosine-phosphatase family protein n=1 Tax=uncultured Cellulomonas sp. TaxID=189682 RepID=UPI0028E625CA|nr:low molecular weight phosphatase family protein [uncultured Cellulomonas sp.]